MRSRRGSHGKCRSKSRRRVSDAWRAPAFREVVPGTVIDVRPRPVLSARTRPALHPLCELFRVLRVCAGHPALEGERMCCVARKLCAVIDSAPASGDLIYYLCPSAPCSARNRSAASRSACSRALPASEASRFAASCADFSSSAAASSASLLRFVSSFARR